MDFFFPKQVFCLALLEVGLNSMRQFRFLFLGCFLISFPWWLRQKIWQFFLDSPLGMNSLDEMFGLDTALSSYFLSLDWAVIRVSWDHVELKDLLIERISINLF